LLFEATSKTQQQWPGMRSFLSFSARILVSALLLYFALRGIDFAEIRARLAQGSAVWFVSWMALSVIVVVVQIFLGALRWQEISALCNAPLGKLQAFRYNMIGTFFNQTLPSTIGGDAIRLWLLHRTGAGWRFATYSILVDRAIGFIALAVVVVVSLPWSYQLIASNQGRLALVIVDVGAICAGVGFLILGYLPWSWLRTWWPTRHVHACSVIANQALFSRKGPKIAMLSITVHVLTAVIAWCAVRALTASADFEQVFLLVPPIALITMLPVSIAGWGVREATMMVAFGYAGLIKSDGTMVSLLTGVTSFIAGIIGGLVWIGSSEHSDKSRGAIPHLVD
jgi:uncharacterized membrane protein YbhN (UPF0104 family)